MSVSVKAKRELVERLLSVGFLTDREKDILKMRLGMESYKAFTLQEIGDKYGITRERVRQIGVSIVRRIKKNMPEETVVASNLFVKTWIPKYLAKKQQAAHRKAASRRKKSIIRNKYKSLVGFITEFSHTGKGKERIDQLFKELRLSYRRNKSLFDSYLIEELRQWRKRYTELKRAGVRPIPTKELPAEEEKGAVEERPPDTSEVPPDTPGPTGQDEIS